SRNSPACGCGKRPARNTAIATGSPRSVLWLSIIVPYERFHELFSNSRAKNSRSMPLLKPLSFPILEEIISFLQVQESLVSPCQQHIICMPRVDLSRFNSFVQRNLQDTTHPAAKLKLPWGPIPGEGLLEKPL